MKKDFIILVIIGFLIFLVARGTKIQSVEDYYLIHIDDITEDSEVIYISIYCDTILDNWNMLDEELRFEKYVPSDGVILELTPYVLRPNDTAFTILERVTRHHKIQMEHTYNTNFGSAYIRGINHLYEFSCGPLSGWMYKVNSQFPSFGSSKYALKDGDVIEWVYTCDLGRDIGNTWEGEK